MYPNPEDIGELLHGYIGTVRMYVTNTAYDHLEITPLTNPDEKNLFFIDRRTLIGLISTEVCLFDVSFEPSSEVEQEFNRQITQGVK